MDPRYAWVLNLDADLELARGAGYSPRAGVARAAEPFARRLRASLVGDRDVVVDGSSAPGSAAGFVGRAFCPTPRAVAVLVRAGADPEPHPPAEVLRRVASRAFSASLGQTMPKAAFVTRLDDARAMLRADPAPGTGWRVKRAFGMAGRGHRVVGVGPREADVAFLPAWIDEAGVQIEPNVRVVDEYALHGRVSRDGSARLGALTRQRADARGAWVLTERAEDAPAGVAAALREQAELAAGALAEAGYFGPFGVDAFRYEGEDGRVLLRARSEVNPRYSMGFAVGFGGPG